MPFLAAGSIFGGVASLFGANKQANAATDAAQIQATAANNAAWLQNNQFDQTRQAEQPWVDAGRTAVEDLQGSTPQLTKGFDPTQAGLTSQFNYNPLDFEMDPAFNATMKYGQQAIERSAAAKGQVLSPSTLKALSSFGQDTAQQYYGQDYSRAQDTYNQNYGRAFNTFTSNQTNAFNKLSSIASLGENAVTQTGSLGAQAASNAGNLQVGAANASSAGVIGSANAWNQGLGGVASNLQNLLGSSRFQGWANGTNNSSY